MNKDVNRIRKNIANRKNVKYIPIKNEKDHNLSSRLFQVNDEERHGHMESVRYDENKAATFSYKKVSIKWLLAALLFIGITGLQMVQAPWLNESKKVVSNALSEEFPFATVNQWYQAQFGSPLLMQSMEEAAYKGAVALPVNGTVQQSFYETGDGVFIQTEDKTDVITLEEGTVIFAGNDLKTKKTIKIQHPDQSISTYGFLSSIEVNQYQMVAKNQLVGTYLPEENNTSAFYFSLQKDQQYIDPVKVIQVHETP
ncbi:M23 family metallopeptidase [Saliterribacillus persicus]|uniref:Stage IV sporulation protein FA n=1 Tax=Saliterribacillus persicus TaxID=930114 RepID=A0A368XFK2_9BACI|nr:M23 family metallopeptidase [Saliterribacillus persicus]RCW66409.1 stage IV sporulation protein FA [Saliterribacillus persicus]